MNAAWSQIPLAQQQLFLNQTGLTSLPEPTALDPVQWTALVNIVGEETAGNLKRSAEERNLGLPTLDIPADAGDWSSIMAVVAEIRLKIGELQQKTATEDIATQKDAVALANKKTAEKIQESLEKLEKAAKSGLLGKIFGWIGAIVGIIAGAVATIATGGAAVAAIGVAVMGLGMMALQESGQMEKIVAGLAKNPGLLMLVFGPLIGGSFFGLIKGGVLDEEKAKMALQVTFAVGMLAASVASMVLTGGASASGSITTLFKTIGLVGQIVGGAASVGSGASGVAQSVFAYQSADVQADMQENKAWLARLQQMLSEEMDRLQAVLDQLNSGVTDASDILSDIAKSNQSVVSHMGA